MKKKGVELSINTIIIVILAILALVVLMLIFTSAGKTFFSDIMMKLKSSLGLLNSTGITKPTG
ncbi:hypothetical protein J4465_00760 [Candidatus Pacearchaeota archaeon]|nr:hypothetical protein [Candidatus Pacearchaeota archaeon]